MFYVLTMTWKLVFIVFFFGFCIFIHEFGHMLAAMWQGLHVERFSLGLGPVACKLFKWRNVDFVLSWIPFGGYVALPQLDAADVPKTEQEQALPPCKPVPRAIVAFAGPFFNILFGFALATVMWQVGLWEAPPSKSCTVTAVPKVLPLYENGLELLDNIVALNGEPTDKYLEEICEDLEPGKEQTLTVQRDGKNLDIPFMPQVNPEWEAGLRAEDRIVAVNGKPFSKGVEELLTEYVYNDSATITLTIIRNGQRQDISYSPVANPMMEGLGTPFFSIRNPLAVGGVQDGSPACLAGLRTGDQLLQLNNTNIVNAVQFLKNLEALGPEPFDLLVSRNGQELRLGDIACPQPRNLASLGIHFAVIVDQCLPDMPAAKAGMKIKDKILKVNGEDVMDSKHLTKLIKGSKGQRLTFALLRDGKELELVITPQAKKLDNGQEAYVIGAVLNDSVPKLIGHPNPWQQFSKVISQSYRTLGLLFAPITSKITGHSRSKATVKVSHMSGPIGIMMMMWYSLKAEGLRGGLALIILVTFSLAFMNLLPIPALDGSYILFSIVELLIRRRLPAKFLSVLVTGFFILLLCLIAYISFFDVRRVFRLVTVGSTKGVPAKVEKANKPTQETPGAAVDIKPVPSAEPTAAQADQNDTAVEAPKR